MASSKVQICNVALASLGQRPIASLSEDSEAARKCNLVIDDLIDEVLRAYPWNCAQARAILARSATAPAWGYAYAYALPTTPYCLRVLGMEDEDAEYRIEGRYLLTDEAEAKILYVKRIVDPNEFDPLCRAAISARLAAEICYAVTNSHTLEKTKWDVYAAKVGLGEQVDAQETSLRTHEADSWIDARI